VHDIRPDTSRHDGHFMGCKGIGYYMKEAFVWHVC